MSKKTKSVYPPTPELDKLQAVKEHSHICGEFLEWLQADGIELCRRHEHTKECYSVVKRETPWSRVSKSRTAKELTCGMHDGQLWPESMSIEKTLARFFKIDLNKVEEERRSILEHLRNENNE